MAKKKKMPGECIGDAANCPACSLYKRCPGAREFEADGEVWPGGKILSMVCTGCKSEAEFYVTFYDRELVCVTASGKIKRNESCPVPSTRSAHKTLNIKTLKDLAKAIAENNKLYPGWPAGYGCSCKDCDESTNARICFEDGTTTYDVEVAFRKAFPSWRKK